jgi:hypothetical protein
VSALCFGSCGLPMSSKPASRQVLLLQLSVLALLLVHQAACRNIVSGTPDVWPTLFRRMLQQDGTDIVNLDPQQRDPTALCQLGDRPGLTNLCHLNCLMCDLNSNATSGFRTCECCKAGYFGTPGAGNICTFCPPGTWSNAGSSTCRYERVVDTPVNKHQLPCNIAFVGSTSQQV